VGLEKGSEKFLAGFALDCIFPDIVFTEANRIVLAEAMG
jgi:hypothetical protein